MEYLTEEDEAKYKEHFASYIENEITFDDVEEMYKETHKTIRGDPSPAPKASFTPDKSFKNKVGFLAQVSSSETPKRFCVDGCCFNLGRMLEVGVTAFELYFCGGRRLSKLTDYSSLPRGSEGGVPFNRFEQSIFPVTLRLLVTAMCPPSTLIYPDYACTNHPVVFPPHRLVSWLFCAFRRSGSPTTSARRGSPPRRTRSGRPAWRRKSRS